MSWWGREVSASLSLPEKVIHPEGTLAFPPAPFQAGWLASLPYWDLTTRLILRFITMTQDKYLIQSQSPDYQRRACNSYVRFSEYVFD